MNDDSASDVPLSVLLVEEDSSVAHLVMFALRSEGYRVMGRVASAREAERVANEESPDLVLLDRRMIPLEEFDLAS